MIRTTEIKQVARQLTWWSALFFLIASAIAANVSASEPDFLGTLQLAIDDDSAALLKLTPDVRNKLVELAEQRAAEGKRLLTAAKLPASEQRTWLERWMQASEQLANELLTLKQREQLTQLLLARDGLVTLARPDVQSVLAITPPQAKKISELLVQRSTALEGASRLRTQIVVGSYERKLQATLTSSQLAQWEVMAGNQRAADVAVAQAQVPGDAAGAKKEDVPAPNAKQNDVRIRFAFDKTPWRDVIEGMAKKADLSVFVTTMPSGSLTYADEREYTLDEAIERINRFLFSSGYALVRSGKMLSVIGLQDSGRDQLLDSLAEYVTLSELDRRGDNEIVKCIFTFAKADPKEALAEIQGLVKLSSPMMMPKSRQLLVIETAAKLRMIRDTLEAMESTDSDSGPVRRFELEHARPKDVIDAIRPLVGITDTTTMVGEQISLSIDADGQQILATGSAEKLAIIEGAVKMLDKLPVERAAGHKPVLRTHLVQNGNLQVIDDVLQTLLADDDVRLAQEPKTSRLILLATEEVHERVEKMIGEFEGEATVFEVIQLKVVEPYVAMSVIREMFDIPFFKSDEDEASDADHPRLDWDTPSMRLFVRGTRSQVDAVKEIVDSIEKPQEAAKDSTLRLLPIQGKRAEKLLETGGRFWPGSDDVLIFPPSTDAPSDFIEREINGPDIPPPVQPKTLPPMTHLDSRERTIGSMPQRMKLVNAQANDALPPAAAAQGQQLGPQVKAQVTPRGILLQSDDVELLNRFEEHLRTIAGPGELSDMRLAIFYLKHVHVQEAKSLLSDIRRGGSSSSYDDDYDRPSGGSDSMGPPRPRRSFSSFSEPSIIADARLNRLIVQGKATEILAIEKHLQLIDRDESITDIQFRGKPQSIQLRHLRATDAAVIIRDAYRDQLGSPPVAQAAKAKPNAEQLQAQQLAAAQAQQQPKEEKAAAKPEAKSAQKGGRGEEGRGEEAAAAPVAPPAPRGQTSTTFEPTMTLAVDVASNALIIRAPKPLFDEVSELVRLIDKNAAQTTAIVPIRGGNASQLQRVLRDVLGKPQQGPKNTSTTPEQPTPAPQVIQLQTR